MLTAMIRIYILLLLFSFSFNVRSQNFTSSNLPIVIIETDKNPSTGKPLEIPDEPKILGSMKIIFRSNGSRNNISDQSDPNLLNYNGRIRIEIRGSTSQLLDKKPYSLTTYKSDEKTYNNVSLLGMPEENDWILNSLAFDSSLIRDYLSYDLSREIGQYASRGRYCEVIVNGDYKGLYVLMEKLKLDDNRINLAEMTKSDYAGRAVTGGYIVKSDKPNGDPIAWSMPTHLGNSTDFIYDKPNPFDIVGSQANYIRSQFQALADATSRNNSSIENGFPSIIDVPTFVDFMLMNEIASNVDAYQFSTYYHKVRQGKLRAGPIWDFNLTYGNDLKFWNLNRSFTNVWQFNNGDNVGPKYWLQLYNNPVFKCYLSQRWNQLIKPNAPFNLNVVTKRIDSIVNLISEATVREQQRWRRVGNHSLHISNLKTWLKNRIDWMSSNLNTTVSCTFPVLPTLVISQINYNPKPLENISPEKLEFIEISNLANTSVNLGGIYFKELGISYQFPMNASIGPKQKLYLAEDSLVFSQLYCVNPFGQYSRKLSDYSEKLVLADAFGNTIDSVVYSDLSPWPSEADGKGPFLQLKDLSLDNSLASSWITSTNFCKATPSKPLAINQSFCLNENPYPISATPTPGFSLLWYESNSVGGNGSAIPPKPVTSFVGSKDFYVSQINQFGCESDRAKITASVVDCSTVDLIEIKISPNPTTSYFSITNSNIFKVDIQVYNSTGKFLEEFKNIQPQSNIEIGEFYGAGLYFIKVSGNSKTILQKLIRL
jgi:hypothetical protein